MTFPVVILAVLSLSLQTPPGQAGSAFEVSSVRLALKLEPAIGPVDVLVIDSIERPTED
jgi:uncharacterized protein (TIGR03435 family)